VTVGDRVFKHFRLDGLADFASEKIIQHMFSVRALVAPEDSLNLIREQAKNGQLARSQTLERLGTARTFLAADTPALKTAQTVALAQAWEDFGKRTDAKTVQNVSRAVKNSRLALVVMLIEGLNFSKMMGECALKNDAKSWFGLAASGLTISSALAEVVSVPVKQLYGAESWHYQKFKLYGGGLSIGAVAIVAVFDTVDSAKFFGKGQTTLGRLYALKAVLGVSSLALTAATTCSYAAPLVTRLTGSTVLGTVMRAVGVTAARIIGIRILCMTLGGWLTVGTFGIQVIIWVITDDGLQDWCSLCVFGSKRQAPDAYLSVKEQSKALEDAYTAVGV
jgi:hypothetical protein